MAVSSASSIQDAQPAPAATGCPPTLPWRELQTHRYSHGFGALGAQFHRSQSRLPKCGADTTEMWFTKLGKRSYKNRPEPRADINIEKMYHQKLGGMKEVEQEEEQEEEEQEEEEEEEERCAGVRGKACACCGRGLKYGVIACEG